MVKLALVCAAAPPDLAALLASWELHLRVERKSPQTVKVANVTAGAAATEPSRTDLGARICRDESAR